jgi:hypothetical protein
MLGARIRGLAGTAALALAACSTAATQPSGQTARLDFTGEDGFVYLARPYTCDAREQQSGDDIRSTQVTAGKTLWIERWGVSHRGRTKTFCKAAASFLPEPGRTYVSDLSRDGAACSLRIYRVDASGEKIPEPSEHAEPALSCGYRFGE